MIERLRVWVACDPELHSARTECRMLRIAKQRGTPALSHELWKHPEVFQPGDLRFTRPQAVETDDLAGMHGFPDREDFHRIRGDMKHMIPMRHPAFGIAPVALARDGDSSQHCSVGWYGGKNHERDLIIASVRKPPAQ